MVADWVKFLRKENREVSENIHKVVEKLLNWNLEWLDIKPIIWYKNYYRCRIWKVRIVYISNGKETFIKNIWYRGDIYNNL